MKVSALPKGKLIKTSGIGSFKYKLSQGTHTTGELHTLHDNNTAVEEIGKIVSDQRRYNRGEGLSDYQIRKDVNRVKATDKNLTLNDKRVVKSIFKGMSAESYKQAGSEENKDVAHGQFIYKRNIKTAALHQYGDAVSQDKSKIFGSINSAIKNKSASDITTPTKPSTNPNFKI